MYAYFKRPLDGFFESPKEESEPFFSSKTTECQGNQTCEDHFLKLCGFLKTVGQQDRLLQKEGKKNKYYLVL